MAAPDVPNTYWTSGPNWRQAGRDKPARMTKMTEGRCLVTRLEEAEGPALFRRPRFATRRRRACSLLVGDRLPARYHFVAGGIVNGNLAHWPRDCPFRDVSHDQLSPASNVPSTKRFASCAALGWSTSAGSHCRPRACKSDIRALIPHPGFEQWVGARG